MFQKTTATSKLLNLNKRIRGVAGGTSASKTVSILLLLIDQAQSTKDKIISVTSESFPHLKRGALRDFLQIMKEHNYYDDSRWNKTDYIYTFETGSIIEFFSVDQPGKVRGPRRDILFINEANNISYETYVQLELRTKEVIWLDWNPVSEFWFYTEILVKSSDVDFVTLTYKDNEALDPLIVKSLESKRGNTNFWKVYGLGQLGELEGKIFTGWKIIDKLPENLRYECTGLDLGFTNDPTAGVSIYYYSGRYILDELLYQLGLVNRDIAKILLLQLPKDHTVIADSAEPKSIEELTQWGLSVLPSTKGADSIMHGIQLIQGLKIAVTKRSLNLIKEYRNYLWLTDKDGNSTNKPVPIWNHCMDAVRYGFSYIEPQIRNSYIGPTESPKPILSTLTSPDDVMNLEEFETAKEEMPQIIHRSQA